MKKLLLLFIFISLNLVLLSQVLISNGSVWKYLDDGSDQGTDWQKISYNDSSWAEGNAQLGYGDGDETTVISYGNSSSNKYICYYFRKTIEIANPDTSTGLKISILRDDGAIVYINGSEVVRSNMPSGEINYNTFASSSVSGASEDIFYEFQVPSSVLINGKNIIAVEVHQRSHTSSDVSFDFKLEYTNLSYFKKAPYVLYPGNISEMLILWQLKNIDTCKFQYGLDSNYSLPAIITTEYNEEHQHKVLLDSLIPNQKYFYKVTVKDTIVKYGSFNTGLPDSENTVTFFAYGDTRTNPSLHDSVAARVLEDITQNNLAHTFILNSGDLVEFGDTENSWDNEFFNPCYTNIANLLANMPYITAMGNHEGQGILFKKYFPYPMYMNDRYYYSFDYGPVHITAIDQETDFSEGSVQYNWLVNDLSTSDKIWKIIIMHEPGWSAGGHSNSTEVQNILQPLFEQYHVPLVITGHNHYYARAVVNGVQHITTGGGGAPLYTPGSSYPNIVTVDKSNHYCKIEINDSTLHFSAIRSNGTLIEEFNIQQNNNETNNEKLKNNWYVYSINGKIFVKTENQGVEIEIYDNLGRRVFNAPIDNEIIFTPKQKGVFFVRYIIDGKIEVKKIIAGN